MRKRLVVACACAAISVSFGGLASGAGASAPVEGAALVKVETSKKKGWSNKKCDRVRKKISKFFSKGKTKKANKLSRKAGKKGCLG